MAIRLQALKDWRTCMKTLLTLTGIAGLVLTCPASAFDKIEDHNKRFVEAGSVLTEIMQTPEKGIPQDLLAKAHCVAIVPGLKRVGFIVGAKYGKGVLTCRTTNGWSAPSTIRIEGGSIGFQIGAGETDLVLLVMNERGKEKLLDDKFTVGGDASVMGGPVGRSATAGTDAQMHAEMLSYSRARGVFAGVSLEGATLRPDTDDNHDIYGPNARQSEIVKGAYKPTSSASALLAKLNSYSPVEQK
jgi:lipid-binding SYLF domain-containing protein